MTAFLLAVTASLLAPAAEPTPEERLLQENGASTDGPAVIMYLRSRTVGVADEEKIERLVKQRGDDDFDTREKASQALVAIGPRARGALKLAAKDTDAEIAKRAEDCLQKIEQGATAEIVA